MALRALFVQSQTEVGGAESALLSLLGALDRNLVSAGVATLGFGRGDLPGRLRALGAEVCELRAGRLRNLPAWILAVWRLARLVRRGGYNVVVANGYHPGLYAHPAARLAGARSAVFCHDFPADGQSATRIERTAFRLRADAYFVPSPAMAEAVRLRIAGRAPVHLVPNGVDPKRFRPDRESGTRLRAELGFAPDHLVLTVAGRLSPGKGQHVFLEAGARVAREVPTARFLVVGDALFGMERDCPRQLRQQARLLGIAGKTVFAGNRADMPAVYAASDIVVVPSIAPEAFGLVALEAMACGRPVVAGRAGALAELVADGSGGLGFKPGDAAELAGLLLRLSADADLRVEMGRAARERAAAFGADAAASALTTALENTVAGSTRTRRIAGSGSSYRVLSGAWSPQRGGVADHSRLLAAALSRAGSAVEGVATGAVPAQPIQGEAPVRHLPTVWNVSGVRRLARDLARMAPGSTVLLQYVPHLYGRWGLSLGAALFPLLARPRGLGVVTHFHEVCVDWSWHPLRLAQSLLQRLAAAAMVAGSRAVSFSTERYARLLRLPLWIFRRRWAVLPSGATAPDDPVGPERRAAARERWARPGERLAVVYGLASRGKRYDLAVAAMSLLAARGVTVRLLMLGDQEAGDPGYCREVRALAASAGLAGRLVWSGPLPAAEIAEALAAADWMWHLESSGLTARSGTAASALAQGLPVIGFAGRGLDAAFRDGENVLLAREMTAEALAGTTARLAADPGLERKLREFGRRLFEETFSWKAIAEGCRRLSAGSGGQLG